MILSEIKIPVELAPRLDIFALLILLGIFQGFFLVYFFLNRINRKIPANVFIGLFVLAMSLTILDIFLNYTGFILKIIWINDYSEPLNFLFGPFCYFFVKTSIGYKFRKNDLWHFLPFLFYLFYMLFYFLQPWQEKYNSFVWAYHPELAYADYKKIIPLDPLYLRAYVNELTFLQFISYAIAAFVVVKNEFKKSGLPVWGKATGKLNEIRIILINIFVVIFIFGFVKVVIGRDLGDNFIAAYIAFIIYMLSFNVIRRSLYFKTSITNDDDNKLKYQKSSLSEEYKQAILSKILKLFETEKYYLDSLVSLPSLSKKIGEAQHHVSQVINELLNQSFFEMIAFYRIEEAKKILKSPQHQNLTIEELAEIVGYNSKSAFNKAFKKHTGLTPSQFRDTISE